MKLLQSITRSLIVVGGGATFVLSLMYLLVAPSEANQCSFEPGEYAVRRVIVRVDGGEVSPDEVPDWPISVRVYVPGEDGTPGDLVVFGHESGTIYLVPR
jgi:hypothetical protein